MKAVFLAAAIGFAAGVLGAGEAEARPAGCSLTVGKSEVFGGTCDFSPHNDGAGSFILTSPTGHFVYVNIYSDEVLGYWNGWERASHAHDSLGTLTRDPADRACWMNGYARVCAR